MKILPHNSGHIWLCEANESLFDCKVDEILKSVQHSGYILFRDFNPTQDEFEKFTNLFGICADTRHVHYPNTGEGLGFHAEDAYNPYRPDVIWFFCAFQGSDGGIPTNVVDGIKVFEKLPNTWKEFCRKEKLRFNRQWTADVWQESTKQYCNPKTSTSSISDILSVTPNIEFEFLSNDFLYIAYQTPIISKTIFNKECFANTMLQAISDPAFYGMTLSNGDPIPAELIDIVEKLSFENEEAISWLTGDIALIDNLRMMHKRSAYKQIDRDLRARHGENFFGTILPDTPSQLHQWVKSLIQGDIALPSKVGYP